jgi:hypothetical protein
MMIFSAWDLAGRMSPRLTLALIRQGQEVRPLGQNVSCWKNCLWLRVSGAQQKIPWKVDEGGLRWPRGGLLCGQLWVDRPLSTGLHISFDPQPTGTLKHNNPVPNAPFPPLRSADSYSKLTPSVRPTSPDAPKCEGARSFLHSHQRGIPPLGTSSPSGDFQ